MQFQFSYLPTHSSVIVQSVNVQSCNVQSCNVQSVNVQSAIVRSCNVQPCEVVRQCPVLQCPTLRTRPSLSSPAISALPKILLIKLPTQTTKICTLKIHKLQLDSMCICNDNRYCCKNDGLKFLVIVEITTKYCRSQFCDTLYSMTNYLEDKPPSAPCYRYR